MRMTGDSPLLRGGVKSLARYEDYDCRQTSLIRISFSEKILPGRFEYTPRYPRSYDRHINIRTALWQ